MTIVIDTTPLQSGHRTRGIGRYTRQLTQALGRVNSPHRIVLTSNVGSVDAPDLVHYPYFDLFHSHLPWFPQARCEVVTIHDLIPLRFRESFRPGIRSGMNLWLQTKLVQRIGAIITDSKSSKRDTIEFLGVPDARISVIPLGVEKEFRPLSADVVNSVKKQYGLPKEYLLYVGDVNVNKNIPALIQAVKKLPLPLVVVSSSFSNPALPEVGLIEETIKVNDLNERIIRLSTVPVDPVTDLVAIYCGATVYVQPSAYEGFGLPVLEAMACGIPVVSSNAASLPEVVGNAGLLVEPNEVSIEQGIRNILQSGKLRIDLRRKGLERARLMTWERTARSMLHVYEALVHKRNISQ